MERTVGPVGRIRIPSATGQPGRCPDLGQWLGLWPVCVPPLCFPSCASCPSWIVGPFGPHIGFDRRPAHCGKRHKNYANGYFQAALGVSILGIGIFSRCQPSPWPSPGGRGDIIGGPCDGARTYGGGFRDALRISAARPVDRTTQGLPVGDRAGRTAGISRAAPADRRGRDQLHPRWPTPAADGWAGASCCRR